MKPDLKAYLDAQKGKQVAVLGIGVSNVPLIRLLCGAGIAVTACDKRTAEELGSVVQELTACGARLQLGDGYLQHLQHDVIFRTPGMRPDLPELAAARARGAEITSEMEAFFAVCPCKIIAVTGSDGKTTTTTIISELLKAAGHTVFVGGNIGRPLLCDAAQMKPDDIAVLELSSFQLMTMSESVDIAVVTNITPNHLDMHTSMDEYVFAKENAFAHQDQDGFVILNYDNEITRAFAGKAKGRVTLFSRRDELSRGVCLRGETICRDGKPVLPVKEIRLPGVHNVENYMAAIAALDGLVDDETIRRFAGEFGGVAHRIELVREINGVRYYNDSIASSPTRTIAGLRSFSQKVILIAGGSDKHIPFDSLGPEVIERVKALVLTGATAGKIRAAVEGAPDYAPGCPDILEVEDFKAAVLAAHGLAEPGDVVILSPACPSFDKFKNFAERGDTFKQIVLEL